MARRDGVTDIQAPGPSKDVLNELEDEYGVDIVRDGIALRKYWEWSRMPQDKRGYFGTYVIETTPHQYRNSRVGCDIVGVYQRLRSRFPYLPENEALPVDENLLKALMMDTLYVPILREIPAAKRTPLQNCMVRLNEEHDITLMNDVFSAVEEEKDVGVVMGGPHLRAVIPGILRLQEKYLQSRLPRSF